jgi:FlaA1/EpsC-like NDP-sugar epimerase
MTAYTALLVALDAAAMAAATLTAKISWLGINPESFHVRSMSIPYGALALLTVPTWVALLALAGAYDVGPFATRPRNWSQVVRVGAQLLALVAVAYYILHLEMLGRGVLVGLVPLAVALTLAERAAARFGLDHLHRRGRARRPVLVVGPRQGVDRFVEHVEANPTAGMVVADVRVVVGRHDAPEPVAAEAATGETATAPPSVNGSSVNGHRRDNGSVRALARPTSLAAGPVDVVAAALADTGAAAVVVTGGLGQDQVRDIAWMLEGTGIALLVTPEPADMPSVRSTMRPVAGLPLLYLDR